MSAVISRNHTILLILLYH